MVEKGKGVGWEVVEWVGGTQVLQHHQLPELQNYSGVTLRKGEGREGA